jgi:hypothetical protein
LFALRDIELASSQRVPGLTGWRRAMGDAQPTPSLNSWMSTSTASKTAEALIGPLCLGNHRCESDLEWAQVRSRQGKSSESVVVLRAKAGKTVSLPAGAEIRWNYGQIDFDCKCADEHVHLGRKRKRLALDCESQEESDVTIPAAKRPRTRSQAAAASESTSSGPA